MTTKKYIIDNNTRLIIQSGLQSIEKDWGELAFIYIGLKNKSTLERIHDELTRDGVSSWDGFGLLHPERTR